MALDAVFLDLCQGVALSNGGVTFDTFHLIGHDVRFGLFLTQALSPDELSLRLVTIGAFRCCFVMTAQTLHSRFTDLPVFLSGGMTDIAIQYSRDVFPVREGKTVDSDLHIFKSFVTLVALRMGNLGVLG
jgi:hypothetical protein